MSLGYMLMGVKPGKVLISLIITRLVPCSTKKSQRARPDDKYKNGVSQVVIPARLSEEKLDEVKTYAAMAYTALNCEE